VTPRRKLHREVRNGKAVYVPQSMSEPTETSPKTARRKSAGVRNRVKPRPGKAGVRLSRLMVLGALGAIASTLWLSTQYLINPDVAFWLDHQLLGIVRPNRVRAEQPQTLSELQKAIEREGVVSGQPIVLKNDFVLTRGIQTASNIAIPIFVKASAADCSNPCQSMHQIRLYRSLQLPFLLRFFQRDPYFRLTDKIAVQGPSAADLQSLDQNPQVSMGSDQPLPLTQAAVYDLAPQPGLWLRLIGLRTQGSSVSTYGQVFYFNPVRERLDLMTNWVSPSGEVPQWQEVTGDNVPELVVNQTVGLEPQYAIYQLQMANGMAYQLRPITLAQAVFESDAYTEALTLARSELWTPAYQLLTQVKQDNPKNWNASAQAQLDYIQLHAKITQAQAAQPSASSIQRILGYLVNGSWTPALDVLASDRAVFPELREMLASDSGRLASQIDNALKATPGDASIIAWGAMLRSLRFSEGQAIAWAQQQSQGNGAALEKAKLLVKQLNQAPPEPPKPVQPTPQASAQTKPSANTPSLKPSPKLGQSPM
jgi:hypothetical protein